MIQKITPKLDPIITASESRNSFFRNIDQKPTFSNQKSFRNYTEVK